MRFRIKKEDGLYLAEYKDRFLWWFVSGSVSKDIDKTREACKQFVKTYERTRVVEKFKL